MPTIGIDASRANRPIKTGVEWYAFYIIQHLKSLIPQPVSVVVYSDSPLEGELSQLPPHWRQKVISSPFRRFWTQGRLAWEMITHTPDLLFVPAHSLPWNTPHSVTTIHDVAFRYFPEYYSPYDLKVQRYAVNIALKKKAHIIVPSEFTKNEIMKEYPYANEDRIHVIPLGYDAKHYSLEERGDCDIVRTQYAASKPYFLYIGRIESKKNVSQLVKAYEKMKAQINRPCSLVLAGSQGVGYNKVRRVIQKSTCRDTIIELGWVPEEHLPCLIHGAEAVVHPSWYEGFGMQIVQAMACGTPVIASTAGSLPEILGGAGLLVSPDDIDEMAFAMHDVLTNPKLKRTLSIKGGERAQEYSWEKTAAHTWNLLEKALEEK